MLSGKYTIPNISAPRAGVLTGGSSGYLEVDYYGAHFDKSGTKFEVSVQEKVWDLAKQLIVWNE